MAWIERICQSVSRKIDRKIWVISWKCKLYFLCQKSFTLAINFSLCTQRPGSNQWQTKHGSLVATRTTRLQFCIILSRGDDGKWTSDAEKNHKTDLGNKARLWIIIGFSQSFFFLGAPFQILIAFLQLDLQIRDEFFNSLFSGKYNEKN